jgi:hypothetical protein
MRGQRVPVGSRIFSSLCHPEWLGVSTQLLIQWVPGAVSLGVKRLRREADHLPPASAKVKKMWTYTFTPPYVFMAYLSTRTTLLFYLLTPLS